MSNIRVAVVDCAPGADLPGQVSSARFGEIGLDRIQPDTFERYLHELADDAELAVVFVGGDGSAVPAAARTLRDHRDFARTRVYAVGANAGGAVPGWTETLDVEDILAPSTFDGFGLVDTVELGLRAYHSLVQDPLYTDYYLDTTYNRIFDWFETTRWNWNEINLEQLNPELLRDDEIDLLTEAAIIEFGTLPGAHNFLREWAGETSFSSWALMWGAEEARHARAFYVFSQELCNSNVENQIAAMKMAYVWLADRSDGIKHPAGHFYPHSTSAKGINQVDRVQEGATDVADGKVLAMVRRLAEDDSIESPRDIKKKLRSLLPA
jgi:hypothetical protein